MNEVTLLILINLLGTPQSDLFPHIDGHRDIVKFEENLVIGGAAWDVTLVYNDKSTLQSLWLSSVDIKPDEWSAMSLEMSSIGLKKISESTTPVGRVWIVEEKRLGLGLDVVVVFSSGLNKSSVSIKVERCGTCIASL